MRSRGSLGSLAVIGLVVIGSHSAAAAPASCDGRSATIVGTSGNDRLTGTPGPDVISALGGSDTVYAGGGDDVICSGTGDFDAVFGESGDDRILMSAGVNTSRGDSGNDYLSVLGGGAGRMDYTTSPRRIVATLADGTVTGWGNDTLLGFETLTGSKFNDKLTGSGRAEVLTGGEGDDVIEGGGGDDYLTGDGGLYQTGSDTVRGGPGDDVVKSDDSGLGGVDGNDHLSGGPGHDNFFVANFGDDTIDGGGGEDYAAWYGLALDAPQGVRVDLTAGTAEGYGNDTVSSIENVYGTDNDDVLVGDGAINSFVAREGDDIMRGGGNDDLLHGDGGNDSADGEAGDDACDAEVEIACEF